jgi:hypothetical protein
MPPLDLNGICRCNGTYHPLGVVLVRGVLVKRHLLSVTKEYALQERAPMRVTVTNHDLLQSTLDGGTHPIARALHFGIGGDWKVSQDQRWASETIAPFRVVPLPESVALFMKD